MYKYNENFYQYINEGAVKSAEVVVPTILDLLPNRVNSVLDVGCGVGAWLSVWKRHGCTVSGLDGAYVDRGKLLVNSEEFIDCDLTKKFSQGRRFDLVQCLEVAEHLPESAAAQLIEGLCEHSDLVVFSAAAPGQGGENHLNEKGYDYWRDLFKSNDYQMYDGIRAKVVGNLSVKPWYRYNVFIFVNRKKLPDVHHALGPCAVDPTTLPKDISPMLYRLRKMLISFLPVKAQTLMAILKKSLFNLVSK